MAKKPRLTKAQKAAEIEAAKQRAAEVLDAMTAPVCELGTPGPPKSNVLEFPQGIPPALMAKDPKMPPVNLGTAGKNPYSSITSDDEPYLDLPTHKFSREIANSDLKPGQRKVTLIKDHILDYPELYLEVFLQGPPEDCYGFPEMFARAHCTKANSIEEADLVVFAGGPDVNPALYGAEKHNRTYFDDDRDTADIGAYLTCYELGIPMLGICRGAQFLNVMNGGALYQDVDNHNGDHNLWDHQRKIMIEKVSSVHHQMVIANATGGMEIIGTSASANNRWLDPKNNRQGTFADVEAFFYPETCCIGIQGHPEYRGYPKFTQWSLELVQELVCLNVNVKGLGEGRKYLRLTDEFRKLRKTKIDNVIKAAASKAKEPLKLKGVN